MGKRSCQPYASTVTSTSEQQMSIVEGHGNLLRDDAEALVNTVNTVGVAGKGIALQFRQAYPANYKAYAAACKRGEVVPGKMFVHPVDQLTNPRYIINFPTKRHWRARSRIEDIRTGLADLVRVIEELDLRSIAVPPLGCGNGGLEWDAVRPLILAALENLPNTRVILHSPGETPPPEEMPVATDKPKMTPGRAVLLALFDRYLVPGYRLTGLEAQKLAYFLQVAGEPLRLAYVKAPYGPYAEALNHVLRVMEGHYIRGFGDRSAQAQILLLDGAVSEATHFLAEEQPHDVSERLFRVEELVRGYDTPYGLELLATTHWAVTDLRSHSLKRVARYVADWTPRKAAIFKPAHVEKALHRLDVAGFLPAA
jgi:O-acetyl-ADP-ribose deacetylase (regulator of RNase III)